MKKLIIFGASGPTGRHLVTQALQAGHEVTAVVRNPDKLSLKHERLTVVKGNALQPETYAGIMSGKDAVLSALGATDRGATTVYSEGAENIVKAMNAAGLKRLIVVTSETVGMKEAEGPSWLMRWLIGTVLYNLLKFAYEDMKRMEAYLKNVDLDWTIVRPARLTDKPLTGKYKVELNRNVITGYQISRADLSHYMLSIIDEPSTHKGIAILYY